MMIRKMFNAVLGAVVSLGRGVGLIAPEPIQPPPTPGELAPHKRMMKRFQPAPRTSLWSFTPIKLGVLHRLRRAETQEQAYHFLSLARSFDRMSADTLRKCERTHATLTKRFGWDQSDVGNPTTG